MNTFKNILVLCDGAKPNYGLIEQAMDLASAKDAAITLVDTVAAEPGEFARTFSGLPGNLRAYDAEAEILAFHLERLWRVGEPLRAHGITTYQHVLQGTAFIEVIKKVLRDRHDLVIKAAQRDPDTLARASTDLHLLRKCPCPVWLVNDAAIPASAKVLAAVAPESEDRQRASLDQIILDLAVSSALARGGETHVLNAWSLTGEDIFISDAFAKISQIEVNHLFEQQRRRAERSLESLAAGWPHAINQLEMHLIKGDASDVVPRFVRDHKIDLLVMGTVAKTGVSGLFMGGTAETILNRVDCSIVAVKPPAFKTPVHLDADVIDFSKLAERERRPKLRISA